MTKFMRWASPSLIVRLAVLVSLAGSLTISVMAQPMPVPDVLYWVHESKLIVIGRILDVRGSEGAQTVPHRAVASVQIESVLKGEVKGGEITVAYQETYTSKTHRQNTVYPNEYSLQKNQFGILYLTRDNNGKCTFADPYEGLEPITTQTVPLAALSSTPEERVETELFASLSDPDRSVAALSLQLVNNLASVVQLHNKPKGTKGGEVPPTEALRKIADSSNQELQGLAFAGLIHLGDYSLIGRAIRFVHDPTSNPNTQYWKLRIISAIAGIGDDQIRKAFDTTNNKQLADCPSKLKLSFDSSVLPQLYPLLSSPNAALRESVSHALRGICDPSSAPYLMRALHNSDRRVQYDALMGLAALEGFPRGLPTPTETEFDQDPEGYIRPWESWWEATGKKKYVSHQ